MMDEHMRRLRDIELSLERIAVAIEDLVNKIDRVTGKTDHGTRFIRVTDLGPRDV